MASTPAANEVFWNEVANAYGMVSADNNRTMTIERNGKAASVYHDPTLSAIMIVVTQAETDSKDPLPVP